VKSIVPKKMKDYQFEIEAGLVNASVAQDLTTLTMMSMSPST